MPTSLFITFLLIGPINSASNSHIEFQVPAPSPPLATLGISTPATMMRPVVNVLVIYALRAVVLPGQRLLAVLRNLTNLCYFTPNLSAQIPLAV